ncbi:MAG: AtpZ/AtpI family protein [Alphaproteobacteria bacterium]
MADNKAQLDDLDQRISDAKKNHKELFSDDEHADVPISKGEIQSSRAASEFLASVFAGGFIGYGFDWFFSTIPWGLISFMIIGFASGVYRANDTMASDDEKNEEKTK